MDHTHTRARVLIPVTSRLATNLSVAKKSDLRKISIMNGLYLEDGLLNCLLNGQSETLQKYLAEVAASSSSSSVAVHEPYMMQDNASLSPVSTVSSTSSIASSPNGTANLPTVLLSRNPIYLPNNGMLSGNLYNTTNSTGSTLFYQTEMASPVDSSIFPWITGKTLSNSCTLPESISNLAINLNQLGPKITGLN